MFFKILVLSGLYFSFCHEKGKKTRIQLNKDI